MMTRIYITALILIISICSGLAQAGASYGGGSLAGVANTGIHLKGISSIYSNPAGLGHLPSYGVDISYNRLFGLQELTNVSLAAAKTTKFGTFGLMAGQFGSEAFNEQKIAVGYARKLSPKVSVGGLFDAFAINAKDVGTFNAFTFEIGGQIMVSKAITFNTAIFSPIQAQYSDETGIGTRFKLGFLYQPSPKLGIAIEAEKPEYYVMQIKGAVSYQAHKAIQINIGANPVVNSYGVGISWRWKEKISLSTATMVHQNLGTSPAVSLQFTDK